MIGRGVVADVAGDAAKPVVLNLELAAAMPAPEQSDKKSAAVTH